jgi:polyhydroxyalkanoate synthesis regulator phasin
MGLGDIVQKAVYLGVGIASYAGEKAGVKLSELRVHAQKMADEMVERGEMTAEEARRFVDEMVNKAQPSPSSVASTPSEPSREPRPIEILDDESAPETQAAETNVEEMRRRVTELQEELRRLKNE